MPKIAYIAHCDIPSRSAYSVHVMKMCAAFAGAGHKVILYVPKNASSSASPFDAYGVQESFEIVYVPRLLDASLSIFAMLAAFSAKLERVDLVYGRSLKGAWVAAMLGLPVALEEHVGHSDKASLWHRLFSSLIKRKSFKNLVLISHALRELMIRQYPDLENRLIVAHDGADVVCARVDAKSNDIITVGYVGQLYAGKGMNVIAELAVKMPKMAFEVVGGDEDALTEWRHELKNVSNLRLTGFMPNKQALERLAHYDIVLAPYQRRVSAQSGAEISAWMSPLKLFEYMAHGKAIICSDLPVLHEVLVHEETCLFVPPDDIHAWLAAIDRLAADDALRQRLGANAKKVFERDYSWEKRGKRILNELLPA